MLLKYSYLYKYNLFCLQFYSTLYLQKGANGTMGKQNGKKKKDGKPVRDCKKISDPNVKCGGHAYCIGCPKNDKKRK